MHRKETRFILKTHLKKQRTAWHRQIIFLINGRETICEAFLECVFLSYFEVEYNNCHYILISEFLLKK
jgi:hypothetical protein